MVCAFWSTEGKSSGVESNKAAKHFGLCMKESPIGLFANFRNGRRLLEDNAMVGFVKSLVHGI